jgi:Domain of unknown function (DUF1877)
MGMTCTLWRVALSDAQRLANTSPDQIEEFLFGERIRTRSPTKRQGLIGWLKSLSPITIETTTGSPPTDSSHTRARGQLDLDWAWHGLHFLLTSTAWEGDEPACFLLKGGDDLGEDEIGNDVPRVLSPVQVQRFAQFLAQLSAEELTRRYGPARMMKLEIYPEVWNRGRESELPDLLDAFEQLREFVRTAATEGEAVIILVT